MYQEAYPLVFPIAVMSRGVSSMRMTHSPTPNPKLDPPRPDLKYFSKVMSGVGIFHYLLAMRLFFSISTIYVTIIDEVDTL